MPALTELIKKIELQSVLVLFCTLLFGYLLLRMDNSLSTPAGILGAVSIAMGLLYTFGSFFSNQIRESYKDVISEYKATISTLRSTHKDLNKLYQESSTATASARGIAGYQDPKELASETSDG